MTHKSRWSNYNILLIIKEILFHFGIMHLKLSWILVFLHRKQHTFFSFAINTSSNSYFYHGNHEKTIHKHLKTVSGFGMKHPHTWFFSSAAEQMKCTGTPQCSAHSLPFPGQRELPGGLQPLPKSQVKEQWCPGLGSNEILTPNTVENERGAHQLANVSS